MGRIPWRAPVYGWLTILVGCALLAAFACVLYQSWPSWLTIYWRLFVALSTVSLVAIVRLGLRQTSIFVALVLGSLLAFFIASGSHAFS